MDIPGSDPVALALVTAIHDGDLDGIETMLAQDPERAEARIRDHKGAT